MNQRTTTNNFDKRRNPQNDPELAISIWTAQEQKLTKTIVALGTVTLTVFSILALT